MNAKNEISSIPKKTKLELNAIYDIFEDHGISKELISLFTLYERRIRTPHNEISLLQCFNDSIRQISSKILLGLDKLLISYTNIKYFHFFLTVNHFSC